MTAWHPFRVVLGQAYRDLTGGFLLLRKIAVHLAVAGDVYDGVF